MAKKTSLVGVLMVLLSAIPGIAETNWELQSVDENGVPNYYKVGADPVPENLVVIEGICLNNPEDMLDPATMWQIFVQGEGDDLGGTAAWAGKWYQSDIWEDELARLNSSGFREGDRVRITGYAMAVGGKANINERHSADPSMNFTVELLEQGVGLPEPELVTIPEMNTFDSTRLTGGERHQCRRIRINYVHVSSGTWGKNQYVTIADADGNTLPMKLCNVDFGPQPTGDFVVIGLGNQEPEFGPNGPIPGTGLTDGYQIWVTRPDGIIYPGDANCDGDVDVADLGILAGNYNNDDMTWDDGDFDGDGDVDIADLGILASNYGYTAGGGGTVPEPISLTLMITGMGIVLIRKR